MTDMTKTNNGQAVLSFDADTGVATVAMAMEGTANKLGDTFGETLHQGMQWALGHDGIKGVILTSNHKDFCVGGDLDGLYRQRDRAQMMARLTDLHALLRMIETAKVPVVAALTGSALGGGYELAMACHHRVALSEDRVRVGLPETLLGLFPGGGGTQRLPRLIGIQGALDIILQGKTLHPTKAKALGLIDATAETREAVLAHAAAWIAANPKAKQPWDTEKFRFPGPRPGSNQARQILMGACGMLFKKSAGAYPGLQVAVSAIAEGTALSIDNGLKIEARYFTQIACSDQAKDMIRTIWYHRRAAEKAEGLPRAEDGHGLSKVGIIGAGMMGAGLANVCAQAGLSVVLKDIGQPSLDKAKAHVEGLAKKNRRLSDADKASLTSRVQYTLADDDLQDCDLIIEAVFENLELKHSVTKALEPKLAKDGIWATNTSAIPIADLAKASADPTKFIGLHYFSPVEKMQLVEIITTEQTSDDTLARCLAFTKAIKKLPIVVGDGYGFFTSRVFSSYIMQGAQLVAEGHDPATIEWAARRAGMVVSPLQVFDEVTLSLAVKASKQSRAYGQDLDFPGMRLVQTMVDQGRVGKAAGAGFYDYGPSGRTLWPGLAKLVDKPTPPKTGLDLLGRILLSVQAREAVRAIEDGVIKQYRDAEVGAVFGIGFAPNTGGPLSWIDRRGVATFVAELRELAESYGPRWAPPDLLIEMAEKGERFFPEV
ncbi:MAG: enoyl-CoA hydratase/isomerase family protein [Nannocystaceae bacterium]|nr:enoyl-CoA hydratase/isomerase family protein [Nannocystaceae bacterium]